MRPDRKASLVLASILIAAPALAEHQGDTRGDTRPEERSGDRGVAEKVRPVPNDPYHPGPRPYPRDVAVEIWTDRGEGARYCDGEPIRIYFRANRDAYVTVYDLDTRGRVSVLFPSGPYADNYVEGGRTYELGGYGYHFEVEGPQGWEHLRAVASLDRRASFRRGERPRLWSESWSDEVEVEEFDRELGKRVVPVPDEYGGGHGGGYAERYDVSETAFFVRNDRACYRYASGPYGSHGHGPRVQPRRPW